MERVSTPYHNEQEGTGRRGLSGHHVPASKTIGRKSGSEEKQAAKSPRGRRRSFKGGMGGNILAMNKVKQMQERGSVIKRRGGILHRVMGGKGEREREVKDVTSYCGVAYPEPGAELV